MLIGKKGCSKAGLDHQPSRGPAAKKDQSSANLCAAHRGRETPQGVWGPRKVQLATTAAGLQEEGGYS